MIICYGKKMKNLLRGTNFSYLGLDGSDQIEHLDLSDTNGNFLLNRLPRLRYANLDNYRGEVGLSFENNIDLKNLV